MDDLSRFFIHFFCHKLEICIGVNFAILVYASLATEILELDENLNKEFHEFKKNLRKHMQLCLQVMD
ncbi:hypothetical protein YC2023_122605 [Brassica napus]